MVEVGWSMHLKSSENKSGMCFSLCILISNWQLSTHLSLHIFCVSAWCRPGKSWPAAKRRSEISWAPQRYRYSFIFSHQTSQSQQSNHVLKEILHQQSPSPEANAVGRKRNEEDTTDVSQLRGKVSAGSAVLLNTLCNFLTHVEKCRCFVLFDWRNK